MGAIEKQVKQREHEKHLDTDEFIGVLLWFIRESGKIEQEFVKAKSELNEEFNTKIRELATK